MWVDSGIEFYVETHACDSWRSWFKTGSQVDQTGKIYWEDTPGIPSDNDFPSVFILPALRMCSDIGDVRAAWRRVLAGTI